MDMQHVEAMGDRHDEIREQLSLMEGWVEQLPLTNVEDRRVCMLRIVEFLERYVLADARREERELFPSAGPRADVLRYEHGYIARWVHELAEVAHANAAPADGVRFRAIAFKLFGLLEAHMHCEEVVLGLGAHPTAESEHGAFETG